MSSNVTLHVGKRKAALLTSTPDRKTAKVLRLETPDKNSVRASASSVDSDEDGEDRQEQYEATVKFSRMDEGLLSASQSAVLERVKANYTVPRNLTVDKLTYGPLAGQSIGERIVGAYLEGKLRLKKGGVAALLCTHCAGEGHRAQSCPKFFA